MRIAEQKVFVCIQYKYKNEIIGFTYLAGTLGQCGNGRPRCVSQRVGVLVLILKYTLGDCQCLVLPLLRPLVVLEVPHLEAWMKN